MKKRRSYYVTEPGFENLMNAGILRTHNQIILDELGFTKINLDPTLSFLGRIKNWWLISDKVRKLNNQDIVVFHFPIHSRKNKTFLRLLSKKNIPAAVIIVDIDGLRDNNEALLKRELTLLNQFKWIIAHNNSMVEFLQRYLPSKIFLSIELFDYPTAQSAATHTLSNTTCFAGNIEKSAFIYSLYLNTNIYGVGFDSSKAKANLFFKGAFDSKILPAKLEGSFGLVWDGNDVHECDPYLQYNNPYKLSLYIAASMPVIVWNKSAVANFVTEKNIGIVIDDLTDLQNRIAAITLAEYEMMRQNVAGLSILVTKGFFLNQVVQFILDK